MTFYLKYRPQTLDQIAGQQSVKQTLLSSIMNRKLSHAYLLCGPRGTGKTSTARILAKIVNCEKETPDPTQLPCNACESCMSITNGSNLDVIEMDAASNGLVDDIRSLRENIKLAASGSKKKVYIIDEVHMLSTGAFNALLKTLEEPPSHVLFILATTEAHKIPATILSRVQRLDFKHPTAEEIALVLEEIAKQEGIAIDKSLLLIVAKKAQGSFRDGVKLLDQLSSLEKIDEQSVEETLGTGNFDNAVAILQLIAAKDATKGLEQLSEILSHGINLKEFQVNVLDILRQVLLIKNQLGEQLVKPDIGNEKYLRVVELSQLFKFEQVIKSLELFQRSLEQMRFSSIPTLPIELAIVESCVVTDVVGEVDARGGISSEFVGQQTNDTKQLKQKIDQLEDQLKALSRQFAQGSMATPRLSSVVPQSVVYAAVQADDIAPSTTSTVPSEDMQKIQDRWNYVLETVRQYNYSLEALLRSAKMTSCDDKNVIIEVPYSFHQRILEAPKSRDLLESILADILGRSIRVSTVLGKRPIKNEEIANVEVAADDEMIRIAAEIFSSDPVN